MTAVQQMPLFRRLPPPKPLPAAPRLWLPTCWRQAVAALQRLRQLDLPLVLRRAPPKRVKWTLDASTLPFDVKPTVVIWMILHQPPPKPLCYDTMERWQDDLMRMHTEGQTITRRQDIGKHARDRPRVVSNVFDMRRIDYCDMCLIGSDHQRRMQRERRCILPVGFEPVSK